MAVLVITNRTDKNFSLSHSWMALGWDDVTQKVANVATFHRNNLNVPPGEMRRFEMDDYEAAKKLMKDQHPYGVRPEGDEESNGITYEVLK